MQHARILGRLKRPLPCSLIEVSTFDGKIDIKGDNLKNHELAILIAEKLVSSGRDKVIDTLKSIQ